MIELLVFLAVVVIFIGSVLAGFGIWLWVAFWQGEKATAKNNKYWIARCKECGWKGSSKLLHYGYSIVDSEDSELYCPICDSSDVEDLADSEFSFFEHFNFFLKKITFWGLRRKIKADISLDKYLKAEIENKKDDYDWQDPEQNPYLLSKDELKKED